MPHAAEQGAIREIRRLRAEGRPLRAIADAVRPRASRSATKAALACLEGLTKCGPLLSAAGNRGASEGRASSCDRVSRRAFGLSAANGRREDYQQKKAYQQKHGANCGGEKSRRSGKQDRIPARVSERLSHATRKSTFSLGGFFCLKVFFEPLFPNSPMTPFNEIRHGKKDRPKSSRECGP